ncbi:hypothetical protein KY310_01190 [Candidatus Woesearchaeota archaeon]|nr:hypothetical protein [Candidatus Woesearchaeota archaeon]
MSDKAEKEKPQFPLEKILNVTATEYCLSVGKKLSDYELRGVHFGSGHNYENAAAAYVFDFAENIPKNAEVVVNYQMSISKAGTSMTTESEVIATGVALIPKKEPKKTASRKK